jgi:predicted metal-dependent hydrolase
VATPRKLWETNVGLRPATHIMSTFVCLAIVKKPKDLLEYVIVHEMAHLIEPNHSDHFVAILDKHYPNWRTAQNELNELPI